jgi:thrombospondin type 3 repeat protein
MRTGLFAIAVLAGCSFQHGRSEKQDDPLADASTIDTQMIDAADAPTTDAMADASTAIDTDGDGQPDATDNCPAVANADQRDSDRNGVGDACNDAEDTDGDEWADALDNCADRPNDQLDRDGDLLGDLCDPYPDNPDNYRARCEEAIDNEERFGEALLLCEAVRKFRDADSDGEDDATDACPGTPSDRPVDAAGCSLRQFCIGIGATDAQQRAVCTNVDWKNDEPLGNANDCAVQGALCLPRR